MIEERDIAGLAGSAVRDPDGEKIGTVGQVYVDPKTGRPNWTTVKTGLFGSSESFVPLDGADVVDGDLRVRYHKDVVKDAPRIDGEGDVSEAQQDHLYSYYHRTDSGADGDSGEGAGAAAGTGTSAGTEDDARTGSDVRHDDRDRAGEDDSPDRTRDEDPARPPNGRSRDEGDSDDAGGGGIRLRKHVVTEYQTVTIPVEREEIVVEQDANAGAGTEGRSPDRS
ncbi:PRC-barrel domain-containing protein [Microbacterium sp. 179-B 1A2 NHS]|uniref:PRC-barrel domain-containing protein n=1 Tax=Microbacterium sp. 179-B 1A2 NHS TaxID=3142383 RepID=UPI00399F1355